MIKKKSDIFNFIIIAAAFLLTIATYNKLPDLVPIHWNAAGKITDYGPKAFGAFLSPVLMFFTWSGMKYLPKIDPKKENYEQFKRSYSIITNLFLIFFLILHVFILGAALGYNIPIEKVIPLSVGFLFIVIGNYLPKTKSNYFIGIKTPWTLSSDYSWKKTHRLGGKSFVIAGILMIISSLLLKGTGQVVVFCIAVCIAAVVPAVASYFYSKEETNQN